MRQHPSVSQRYMQDAAEISEKSLGPNIDAVSLQEPIADPFPVKTGYLRNDEQDDDVLAGAQNIAPCITSVTDVEDRTVSLTFSAGIIDSWRKSVAPRISDTTTTNDTFTGHYEPSSPQHTNATCSMDIEKQSLHASSRFSQQTHLNGLVERGGAVYTSYREPLVDGCEAKDHTPWILLYLSFLSPPLTFAITLYSLLILFFLLFLSPLSWCTKRKPLTWQIGYYLLPPLDYQFYCLYHARPSQVDRCDDSSTMSREHRSLWLATISLISPLYSLAIALAVWIAAFFWVYAGILGDPNGSGQNDNDGPRAVLKVRRRWCEWLGRAIKT